MRLIDADNVIDNINEWLDTVGYAVIGKGLSYYAELIGCIDESPTIEAEPIRHGHWEIAIGYDPRRSFQCSECGKMAFENSRFCPNCSARMDEVEDNE